MTAKGKLRVKKKFAAAMKHLHRQSKKVQRESVVGASNEFINDIINTLKQLRNKPHLVSSKHVKVLNKHKVHLRKLINKRTSMAIKRKILQVNQRGGIFPFLIPIIAAAIGAAGSVGAAAVGAAIAKS